MTARKLRMAAWFVLSLGAVLLPAAEASAAARTAVVVADKTAPEESSAQARRYYSRRVPSRVRIYRSSRYPGPNAVRVCNAYYVQEYRPSGTVIVPRMRCSWRG